MRHVFCSLTATYTTYVYNQKFHICKTVYYETSLQFCPKFLLILRNFLHRMCLNSLRIYTRALLCRQFCVLHPPEYTKDRQEMPHNGRLLRVPCFIILGQYCLHVTCSCESDKFHTEDLTYLFNEPSNKLINMCLNLWTVQVMYIEWIIELYPEHTSQLGNNLLSSRNACTNTFCLVFVPVE